MISVATAESIILQQAFPVKPTAVPFNRSLGRVLAEDLCADRDFPPFDRVTMDGIAICFERFRAGQRQFPVVGVQAAGQPQTRLDNPGTCIEVMTGAMLPLGCDTVIRYEDIRLDGKQATVLSDKIAFQQNLHLQGIDRKAGAVLVPKGRVMGAAEMATAATIGKATLQVSALPRVAIISTGDELVPVDALPLPHQIRSSNVHAIAALLEAQCRVESQLFHFLDDEPLIAEGLSTLLQEYDLLILSGAVSEGKFDYVPKVLDALGVEKAFHKVSQRPGKPFWFGHYRHQAVVFALPGNPVSAFMCACRYVLPFVRKSLGMTTRQDTAVLTEAVVFKPALTYFMPVQLDRSADGLQRATPLPGHGSGDLANLNDADAFLELPLEREQFFAGEVFPVIG